MQKETAKIIQDIGVSDQQYLDGNTHELAIKRANLRLELVTISRMKPEQIHFLQEAIVLLEQARIEFEGNISVKEYIGLSLHLAKAYMMYFEITLDPKFALITQQIIKPLSQHHDGDIYLMLAYSSAVKKEYAMTRHWLKKYATTPEFDIDIMYRHSAFSDIRNADWFQEIIKNKTH